MPEIYSIANNNKLVVDVRPETENIQLGFQSDENGMYSIRIKEIANISEAILEDTKTQEFHKLHPDSYLGGAYEFTWDINDDEKRFKLHLNTVGIGENTMEQSNISISAHGQQILIKGAVKGKVLISDIMGKTVLEENISGIEQNAFHVNLKTGIYIVMIVAGEVVYSEKVFIKGD